MIFLQDTKERQVYWFLFPIIGMCSGVLLYKNTIPELFFRYVLVNVMFITLLVSVVYLYSKFKLKTTIRQTFGLGDGLLFLALAFSFSSVSFIILFVFGLVFSLVLHLFLKQKSKHNTVPLAGYLSFFFAITYLAYWSGILKSVYSI